MAQARGAGEGAADFGFGVGDGGEGGFDLGDNFNLLCQWWGRNNHPLKIALSDFVYAG